MTERLIEALFRLTVAIEISNERFAGSQEARDENRETAHNLFAELLDMAGQPDSLPSAMVKGFIFTRWPGGKPPATVSKHLSGWLQEMGFSSVHDGGIWVFKKFDIRDYGQYLTSNKALR